VAGWAGALTVEEEGEEEVGAGGRGGAEGAPAREGMEAEM
jgi:hypothetical protein